MLLYTLSISTKGGQGGCSFEKTNGMPLLEKQYIKIKLDYNYYFSL